MGTTFVHDGKTEVAGDIAQHWAQAVPGPEGYVVGRVGLPATWGEMGKLVAALRAQLVLNVLFMTAFEPAKASADGNGAGDDDDDDDADVDLDARECHRNLAFCSPPTDDSQPQQQCP